MSDKTIVLPALDYSKFGYITEDFDYHLFMEYGHFPTLIETSDLNLMSYVDNKRGTGSFPVMGQINMKGSIPNIKIAVSVSAKVPSRKFFYEGQEDSMRVSDLFVELTAAVENAFNNVDVKIKKSCYPYYDKRLEAGTAFKVNKMRTFNMEVGKECWWESERVEVTYGKGKVEKETRLKLSHVDGKESADLTRDTLFTAAGDMFCEQCTLGFIKKTMCAGKKERLNRIKSVW